MTNLLLSKDLMGIRHCFSTSKTILRDAKPPNVLYGSMHGTMHDSMHRWRVLRLSAAFHIEADESFLQLY